MEKEKDEHMRFNPSFSISVDILSHARKGVTEYIHGDGKKKD